MLEYVQLAGFGFGVVSFLLSAVSLVLHYAKRAEHPLTAPLQSQIDSIQLTQADIIDRVEHWMKRDRVRKLREGAESSVSKLNEGPDAPLNELPPDPARVKDHLRQQLRQRGMRV